jgi:hypothetical protein
MLPDIQHPVTNLEISYSKSIYTNVKYNSDFVCAFYGCETWSRITGSTQDWGSWRKLHNEMYVCTHRRKALGGSEKEMDEWATHVTRTLEKYIYCIHQGLVLRLLRARMCFNHPLPVYISQFTPSHFRFNAIWLLYFHLNLYFLYRIFFARVFRNTIRA